MKNTHKCWQNCFVVSDSAVENGLSIRCLTETAPIVAVQLGIGLHASTAKLFSHRKVSLIANCSNDHLESE
jgi:hypothetical protein